MATYTETQILRGLLDHLAELVLSPAMEVSWPNVAFTPPAEGYLRATHVPNTVNQVTLGDLGKNRHIGLFQIDVFWPQNAGDIAPMERAGAVAAHFKRGTVLTSESAVIRIIRPPSIAQALQSAPYIMIPVTIQYQVDASNP